MLSVAIKSLFSHKLRIALTAVAIILSVSFISGTYVFTDSIAKTFEGVFDDAFAGIDVTVRRTQDSDNIQLEAGLIDEPVADTIRNVEGVKFVAPEAAGIAIPIDKEGEALGVPGAPNLGFSWSEVPELNQVIIKEGNGRAPERAGEIALDAGTAEQAGFVIGDSVTVQGFGPAEEFELVGVVSFGETDSLAGATLTIFELKEAQRVLNMPGQFSAINVKAEEGITPEALRDTIAAVLSDDLEAVTGDQQTQEQQDQINQGLGFINTALLSFAGLAIFVGAFIIQNTFRIVVAQRSRELALLRAVGAKRSQIVRLVLSEAAIVASIASAIGVVVGIGISYAIRGIANSAGLGLPEGALSLLPRTIIVSMVVGIIVTLLSALLPAIKASRITPIEALRDNEASAKRRSLLKRGIFSSVVILIGLGQLLFGLFGDIANPLYIVGSGAFFMFMGVAFFAPLLSGVLARVLSWPFRKARGITAEIAQQNIGRTPRRTASTASALMIGVALVTFVSVFASSIKGTIDQVVADSFGADLSITSGSPDPFTRFSRTLGESLVDVPQIDSLSRVYYDLAKVNETREPFIAGIEPDTFDAAIKVKPSTEFSAMDDRGSFLYKDFADDLGVAVGDEIDITFSNDVKEAFIIVGTFDDPFDADVLIRYDQLDTIFERRIGDSWVAITYNRQDYSADEARAAIEEVTDKFPTVVVADRGELVEDAKEQIDSILALFYGLLGLAVIIAVLGIANTLTLSISERTRELGLLRAVGMTPRQVRSMVRIEAVIISLFGAVLGVGMGIFFAWAILQALESEGLSGFVIDLQQIALLFVLAAIAGVVASLWPAARAARTNILNAITFE